MKKFILIPVIGLLTVLTFTSCQKYFLEKPIGSDTTVDSVFSKKDKAISAVLQAYSLCLSTGLPVADWWGENTAWNHSTLDDICGDMLNMSSWESGYNIIRSGWSPTSEIDDRYDFHWRAIRQAYLVIENIDKVSDYTPNEKSRIKLEMKGLIAYQYLEMFKRYGGVPIVRSSLTAADEILIPRATLQETLDFIVQLCDEAKDLPNSYPENMKGLLTAGVPLAIKAEAYLYAARPLFNSATPYLSLGADNNLICFGNEDPARWQAAADASKAVVDWSMANGYHIINTGSPLDDYGNATSTPDNEEVLLAYHYQIAGSDANKTGFYTHYNLHYWDVYANYVSFSALSKYYKADGTNQTWADATPRPFSEYVTKMEQMEPRLKASIYAFTIQPWNNPGDQYWAPANIAGPQSACALTTKFWYKAGTRSWINFPIYRIAEFYLNMAEAYNEAGNSVEALANLNIIRKRAGLPNVTVTGKDALRLIIQREWAIEFWRENHRLHDVKHWRLENIGTEIIGGQHKYFTYTYSNPNSHVLASDYKDYALVTAINGYWNPNMFLNPFPQTEVNKKYIIQNPGY